MKKKLSMLLAASLLSTMLVVPAHAAEQSAAMTRASTTGADIVTVTATSDAASYEYQWVWRATANGTYTELPTEKSDKYYVSPRDKNRYLNCKITPVNADGSKGEAFYASEDMLISSIGRQGRTTITFKNQLTPAENMFKLDVTTETRDYILLDYFNDEDSAAYIMMDQAQFCQPFDTAGHTQFETDCTTNIGYLLNSDYYKQNGMPDPDAYAYDKSTSFISKNYNLHNKILEHINWDHVWWTEQGLTGDTGSGDYSFKAGVSVLSKTESDKYMEKFGAQCRLNETGTAGNGAWWYLRTERYYGNSGANMLTVQGNTGQAWNKGVSEPTKDGAGYVTPYIRPCFYLDSDFFKTVRLMLSNETGYVLGSAVKEMLVSQYTVADLETIYTDDELREIGFDVPNRPTITASTAQNVPVVLTAKLNDENAVSYEYQWVKKDANGAYKDIIGDKKQTYSVSTLDKKDYINCRVTPVYADGTKGTPATAKNDYYVEKLGKYTRTDSGSYPFQKTTPSEYTFRVYPEGREYILLDEFDDVNSAFYVMDDFTYGKHAFDTADSPKFDPTSPSNLGYILNSEDFETEGLNSTKPNANIMKHIDKNHVWWTEQGFSDAIDDDYSFTAGIAVPSITEMYKYIDKFGYDPNGDNSRWWTRTMRGQSGYADAVLCGCQYGNADAPIHYAEFWPQPANDGDNVFVRTCYFLDADFFKEVKLTDIGDEVKKVIKSRYEKSELAGIYDEAELEALGYEPSITMNTPDDGVYHPDDMKVSVNYEPLEEGRQVKITATIGNETQTLYSDRPEETITETYTLENVPFGTSTVTISIKEDGSEVAKLEKTVYAVPAVEADYGQRGLGVNLNLPLIDRTQVTDYVKNIKALGFNDIRLEFTWNGRAESEAGVYNYDKFASFMNAAKDNDVNVTALFAYNNPLYSGVSDSKDPIDTETERTAFVNYVKAFVTEYPEIKNIEIWNEPNGIGFWNSNDDSYTEEDVANYALLVKAVSDGVKAVAPNVNVYAGAIDVSKKAIEYIGGMFDNDIYEYMDILSYHPYYHPSNVDSENGDSFRINRIDNYKAALRAEGGFKKLAATEFGFSNKLFTNLDNEVVKREVPKAYIVLAANGIDSAEVFCYMDDEYGILKADGTPQPQMYSMAQLNHELNGAQFIGKLKTDTGVSAYVFEKNGKPVIAAWSSNSGTLSVQGSAIEVYDVYGNPVTLTSSSIQLGLDPVYIENADFSCIKSAYSDELAARVAAIKSEFTNLPADISNAIENNSANVKELIKANEGMELVYKSALLDMYAEVEEIRSAYNSIDFEGTVSIPTEKYAAVKGAADNKYAKAAVKCAYDYIVQAQNAVTGGNLTIAAKDAAMAEALLDSAAALSSGSSAVVEEKVEISNVSVTEGKLTFTLTNTTSKQLDVWVATYANNALSTAAKVNNNEVTVGSNAGKIFVWEAGTMNPVIAAVDFNN